MLLNQYHMDNTVLSTNQGFLMLLAETVLSAVVSQNYGAFCSTLIKYQTRQDTFCIQKQHVLTLFAIDSTSLKQFLCI